MNRFKDYVTSGAFHMSLSRRQIEMLCHLDQYGASWGYLSTCGALLEKGLIERVESETESNRVVLTDAGRATLPLLKLAGLYVELPKFPDPVELPPIEVTIKRRKTTEPA